MAIQPIWASLQLWGRAKEIHFLWKDNITSSWHKRKQNSWQELEEAIAKELHEAEGLTGQPRGSTYKEADFEAMRRVQMDSFQEDY